MVECAPNPLDDVFHALSDPTRREMLRRLVAGEQTVTELAAPFEMSLAAASKHVKTLERAGMVRRTVHGRTHVCRLDPAPLAEANEWLRFYDLAPAKPKIVMINGAFGAGKTTLANALVEENPDWLLFDPEEVGAMLWNVCPEPRGDFQDLAAWAPLVVETARTLINVYGRTLVVPMTLVLEGNFETIRTGFQKIAPTHHFALVAPAETIAQRLIERGNEAGTWGHQQIARCITALARPEFGAHLDAEKSVEELAGEILNTMGR